MRYATNYMKDITYRNWLRTVEIYISSFQRKSPKRMNKKIPFFNEFLY